MTLRQKEVLTGIAVLVLAFGWLAAAEAALRVHQYLTFGGMRSVEKTEKYYIDDETGLRLPVPNSEHGKLSINSMGFRGPEVAMPKPAKRLRIVALGSSTTFDPYVSDYSRTWAARALAALSDHFPRCDFDVVNAGVPGFGTSRLIKYFRHYVSRIDPDIVLIWTSNMNRTLDRLARERGVHSGIHYEPSILAEHSLFWAKLETNAVVLRRQRAAHSESGKLKLGDEDYTQTFRARLAELITVVRGSGAAPLLLSMPGWLRRDQTADTQTMAAETALFHMPYMSISGLLEARDAFNGAISSVAERHEVPVIDWTDGVPAKPAYFADSSHLSPAGAALFGKTVGDRVADILRKETLAPASDSCYREGRRTTQ